MKKIIFIIRIIKQDNAHYFKSIIQNFIEPYHCLLIKNLII